ncbi:MAG TPA: hypothetical protein VKA08_08505 [Balneolales bacterium]|nr:hypothetical protein [Balneolales bacterium]
MITGFLTGCGLLGIGGHKPSIPGKIVFSAPDKAGTNQIFNMDADGSHRKQLTHFGTNGGAMDPAWSPDGSLIAFDNSVGATTLGSYLYVMNKDGSNMHPLKKMPNESPKYLVGSGPVWSPDGSKIAYTVCTDCELGGENYQIVVVDVAGEEYDPSQIHAVTNNPTLDAAPAWSPDGRQIAFLSDRDYAYGDTLRFRADIYITNVDGTNLKRLTHNGYVEAPVWNPDGKTITYATSNPSYGLYQIDIQSGEINKIETGLAGNFVFYAFAWSPDGHQLLFGTFNRDYPHDSSLYILDTQTDSLEKVYFKSSFDKNYPLVTGVHWFVPTNN